MFQIRNREIRAFPLCAGEQKVYRMWRRSLALFASCLAALFAITFPSAASVTSHTSTGRATVKPDFAFYKGQTINFFISNTVGSADSLSNLAILGAAAKYLGATLKVTYLGGLQAPDIDEIARMQPTGLNIGTLSFGSIMQAIYAGTGETTVPIKKLEFVSSTHYQPLLLVACTNSPIHTMAQLSSGKIPLTAVDNLGGSNIMIHAAAASWGQPHRYLYGYANAAAAVTGCQRGDGNMAVLSTSNAFGASGTTLLPGLTALALTGPIPKAAPPAYLNGEVPTLEAYAKKDPPKSQIGKFTINLVNETYGLEAPQYTLFMPPGTPEKYVLALVDAVKASHNAATVHNALNSLGIPQGVFTPQQILSVFNTLIKRTASVRTLLNT